MKKLKFLLIALLVVGCSSKDVVKERENIVLDKQKITKEILKESKRITLDRALEIGVNRNLSFKTKEIEEKIAHIDKQIAFGNFLPKVSLAYSRTFLEEPLKAKALDTNLDEIAKQAFKPEVLQAFGSLANTIGPLFMTDAALNGGLPAFQSRVMDKDFQTFAINAEIPIFVPSTWFLYNARSKGENIAGLTKELTEKMLKLKIIAEYYYILALESESNYLEDEVNTTDTLKKNAELAYQTGSILEWESKKVAVFNEVKKHSLAQNKRDLQSARMSFLNTMDLDPFTDIKLVRPNDEKFENITLETAIYEALKNNNLIEIRENVAGIQKDITRIAITNFLPKIVLTGGYINTNAQMLVNNNFLMGTLGGLFTIFNGFQNVNEYRKAREMQKIAFIKREQEIMRVIVETTNAYNQYKSASEDMKIAVGNYEATLGMFNQKKLEKETGAIDDLGYLQALSEYEKSFSLKEKASFQYNVSKAVLDMLMEKSIFKDSDKNDKKAER